MTNVAYCEQQIIFIQITKCQQPRVVHGGAERLVQGWHLFGESIHVYRGDGFWISNKAPTTDLWQSQPVLVLGKSMIVWDQTVGAGLNFI